MLLVLILVFLSASWSIGVLVCSVATWVFLRGVTHVVFAPRMHHYEDTAEIEEL